MSVKHLMNLEGRVALITGGSRGLGLQLAAGLAEMGAKLAITARKTEELEDARKQLESLGAEVITITNDLSKTATVPGMVDTVLQRYGRVDILINNAGNTWGAPAEEHPMEAWLKVVDLNLTGTFAITQEVGRRSMIPNHYGRIVNIASIAGLKGNPPGTLKTIAYNTTKGGLVNFTRALGGEWGQYGITVNAICPGFFPSKMTKGVLSMYGEEIRKKIPNQRFGDDEDLKGLCCLLASDAARHINGQSIAVDGGVFERLSMNLQVTLKSRPQGWVRESDFALVESEVPAVGEGEVLLKTLYLSLDPYMRGRMDDAKSYAKSVNIGDVMVGGAVCEIVESKDPRHAVGDIVVHASGWQKFAKASGDAVMRVPAGLPPSVFLGPAGMPGVTAWMGLFDIGQPKAGETVVVSAASGAVGSVVGQLAKEKGCRVVGIAGGPEKCRYVVDTLGFDACADYKRDGWIQDLKTATPDGVDVIFENVGGEVLNETLKRTNARARVAICGLISGYNASEPMSLPNLRIILVNRIRMQGFIVSDELQRWPEIIGQLATRIGAGKIRYRESIANGLENAPKAFIGLLKGENFGKQLVKVA